MSSIRMRSGHRFPTPYTTRTYGTNSIVYLLLLITENNCRSCRINTLAHTHMFRELDKNCNDTLNNDFTWSYNWKLLHLSINVIPYEKNVIY